MPSSYQERRDKRFFNHTQAALRDIEERVTLLPPEERHAAAYGILRGYFEALLVNFAESFTPEQLGEIRIVLDQLEEVTGDNLDLPEETRRKRNQLAKALREMEEE